MIPGHNAETKAGNDQSGGVSPTGESADMTLRERSFLRHLGKGGRLLVMLLAALLLPLPAGPLASLAGRPLASLDPSGAFAWLWLHHLIQLLLTLGVMFLWSGGSLKSWGFNLREFKVSIRWFGWFALFCSLGTLLFGILPMLLTHHLPSPEFPLTARNVAGRLGFYYVMSGLGEEPLFRGLVLMVLLQAWTGKVRVGKLVMPVAGLWATLLFMLAHVKFTLAPFQITHFSWQQQLFCLGLGLYYAAAFYRTRSLLCPVLAHGFSNGIIYTLIYLAIALSPGPPVSGTASGQVNFEPNPPLRDLEMVVTYRTAQGPLSDATQLSLHWGINVWKNAQTTRMEPAEAGAWRLALKVPAEAEQLDFAFTDGQRWDNKEGRDWHVLTRKTPAR